METVTRNGQGARLTHTTFYKACEVLKTHRERFTSERPGNRKAAEMLAALAGFAISEASVQEIKEASGVTWEIKRSSPRVARKDATRFNLHACRTLARAVRLLYRKLDEELPSALAKLCDYYDHKTDAVPEIDEN